jgi:hypothetical protein
VSVVESSVEAATLPDDPLRRLGTSFGGVPASQVWADYFLWELVLNEYPELTTIVEIGTWQGGFSRYLWAQAQLRGLYFRTVDAVIPDDPPLGFERLDVFAEPDRLFPYYGVESYEPLILLCDGGNKPRELRTFAPMLSSSSLVVAHDWLTEVQPEDVPDCLSMVYEDVCDALGSISRVFRVKEGG